MQHAIFKFAVIGQYILVDDQGDFRINKTVTNDVEYVIEHLKSKILAIEDHRIFYRDSYGEIDEILIDQYCGFDNFGFLSKEEKQHILAEIKYELSKIKGQSR